MEPTKEIRSLWPSWGGPGRDDREELPIMAAPFSILRSFSGPELMILSSALHPIWDPVSLSDQSRIRGRNIPDDRMK